MSKKPMKQVQTARFDVPEYEIKGRTPYRPRIKFSQEKRLRLLKERAQKPMTVIVSEALECYLNELYAK